MLTCIHYRVLQNVIAVYIWRERYMVFSTQYSKYEIIDLLKELVICEKNTDSSRHDKFACSLVSDESYCVWKNIPRHPAGKANALIYISIHTTANSVVVEMKPSLNSNAIMIIIAFFLLFLFLFFRGTEILFILFGLFLAGFALSMLLEYYQIYSFIKEYLALFRM